MKDVIPLTFTFLFIIIIGRKPTSHIVKCSLLLGLRATSEWSQVDRNM